VCASRCDAVAQARARRGSSGHVSKTGALKFGSPAPPDRIGPSPVTPAARGLGLQLRGEGAPNPSDRWAFNLKFNGCGGGVHGWYLHRASKIVNAARRRSGFRPRHCGARSAAGPSPGGRRGPPSLARRSLLAEFVMGYRKNAEFWKGRPEPRRPDGGASGLGEPRT
jgi:hypothetical protein